MSAKTTIRKVTIVTIFSYQCQTASIDHAITRHSATTTPSSTVTSNVSVLKHSGVLSIITVIALSLPKGLAVYIISHYPISSAAGLALSVALVISSLAEGVFIAMLLYYATGSKLKALLCTCFLGSPQLLGMYLY